jgi:SAM-dependent methyltransferase
MEGYDASTYGDRFADVYDEWYDDPAETAAVVDLVAALLDDGADRTADGSDLGSPHPPAVLELGVGTGRLAVPLAELGFRVTGLDASARMLDLLAAKPGGGAVEAVEGDMAGPLPDGPFDVVLVARNTLFNVTTADGQAACLAEVARVLAPRGRFVVEAFVPNDEVGPTSSVEVRRITADRVLLFVDRHDPDAGEVWSSFVDIEPAGITLRPCHIRYLSPEALDAMAAGAGLALDHRLGGWDGSPFDETSTHHVSVYRRA